VIPLPKKTFQLGGVVVIKKPRGIGGPGPLGGGGLSRQKQNKECNKNSNN